MELWPGAAIFGGIRKGSRHDVEARHIDCGWWLRGKKIGRDCNRRL